MAPNRNYLAMEVLVDELARSGVRHACVSPGNRSAPLAFALAREPRIRVWTHVDERSGAFFALGLARATGEPVAVACTSGTAAANLLPAAVEAHHARVPLVLLTADRPPELRERSAGQTIDQLGLYGSHVRWSFDLGVPEPTEAGLRYVRSAACRAAAEARGAPAGVAHLNLPLRDPLDPSEEEGVVLPPSASAPSTTPHTTARTGAPLVSREDLEAVCGRLAAAKRPLVQCGPLDSADEGLPAAVRALADRLDARVLAEPTSNLRRAPLRGRLVHAYEALLRVEAFESTVVPDVVVRIGGPPTSRTVATWLDRDGTDLIVFDETGGWPDPASRACHIVRGETAATCNIVAAALPLAQNATWCRRWRAADAAATTALARSLDDEEEPFEGHVVRALADVLPDEGHLYVGNSLAVRDLDWFWPTGAPSVRVLANRGANGIDGFVSSVLGAAASGRRVLGFCGDLSFFHDLGGLVAAPRLGVSACFVVPNNGGGGIFEFLPAARAGAGYAEHFEELFVTPLGVELGPLVEGYGASFTSVAAVADVGAAVEHAWASDGVHVVEVRVDRLNSREAHARAWAAVRAAVGGIS